MVRPTMDAPHADTNDTSSYSDLEEYQVLIEFAVRHLDFQLAELESVLDMHDIAILKPNDDTLQKTLSPNQCRWVQLPQQQEQSSTVWNNTAGSTAVGVSCTSRSFCVLSFPLDSPYVPKSASTTITGTADPPSGETNESADIATIILSRCTLVRSVLELWGMAPSLEGCATSAIQWTSRSRVGRTVFRNNATESQSWKLTVHTLGSRYSRMEQNSMRAHFSDLNFPGAIQMTDPSNEFVLIREVELDSAGGALYPRHTLGRKIDPENDRRPPLACYFGRALGGCRSIRRMGGKMKYYDLKQRRYLGPTSMDAELSFIMTNLAQVQAGTIAFDPFVGTGSILLSCALRGAYCIGTDIDIRVLLGKGQDENIVANFRQFELPRPELIRSDNNIHHRHFRCVQPIYDAILCDPPYGIRAGARKSGSKREVVSDVKPENRHDHIAQTQTYAVSDVMADLLDVAARTLVLGGRLVYVIPSFDSDFDVDCDLPRHPCLELIHVCYQPLSTELGRRMVVHQKKADYDSAARCDYLKAAWKNGPASAAKCANLREKLLEAAKAKPRYEERLTIRKEKRRVHKEEKKARKKAQL